MTQTITTCDRCSTRCDHSATMLALKPPGDPDFRDFDVCPVCHAAFLAWLDAGRSSSEAVPAAVAEASANTLCDPDSRSNRYRREDPDR